MNIAKLKENAYVPYSDTADVAMVESSEGQFFAGVRIENISFPSTIPAVQNALFCCLSEGYSPAKIYVDKRETDSSILQFWEDEIDVERLSLDELDSVTLHPVTQQLDEKAIAPTLNNLLSNKFVEYSGFPVSALIETSEGFISGINIETSNWDTGLCAERVALAKAITYRAGSFKALHICTRDGEYNSPCGACRQVIVEHLPHHPIYLHHPDGTLAKHFSSDLLPYSFQSSSLKKH